MVIEEIVPQLPKTKEGVENSYNSCNNLKKFIGNDNNEFKNNLEKAKSDLSKVKSDYDAESWDWVIIKSYYAMHHAINSMLIKFKGFYSKDHICAIIALKYLDLLPEDIYLKLRNINAKFSDFTGFGVTYSLRKISQYDVNKWKNISKKDADAVYNSAKELISYIEKRCYE